MGQVHHGSAATTAVVRRAIKQSKTSLRAPAKRHGINPKTAAKWKKFTPTPTPADSELVISGRA